MSIFSGEPRVPPAADRSAGAVRSFNLDELFGAVGTIVVGREPACTLHLPHSSVSLYHAILERTADGLILQDLDSSTGVYINGRRVRTATKVRDGDRFGIGPFLFTCRALAIEMTDNSRSLRLEARSLEKVIPIGRGKTRKLLDDVNLVVRPGEFITLLGPSGSGKSTLMDCLNGRRRATGGKVLANGQDFYAHFDSFRQSLGYVPQRDIVHSQLTVRRALYHTARLRLPIDTEPETLEARIEDVIRQMELGPHQNTYIGQLSGGQIKRVSLGAELLARPPLLYIDEATSGLDAGTESRMMMLFRKLADEGKSIICITHAIENVDQCHLVLVLAGGKLTYFGPPEEAPAFFGVRGLSQVYDCVSSRDPTEWHKQFRDSRYHKEYVEDRIAEADAAGALPPPPRPEESIQIDSSKSSQSTIAATESKADEVFSRAAALLNRADIGDSIQRQIKRAKARLRKGRRVARRVKIGLHQFRVLTNRYVELILHDRRSLRLFMMQAPIVAIFLLVGFIHKAYEDDMPVARPLDQTERQVLTHVNAWNLVLADDESLDPERKEMLQRLKFTVTHEGQETVVDGAKLHERLKVLQNPGLTPQDLAALESLQIRIDDAVPRATVSGKDLIAAYRKAGASRLTDLLLASKKPVVLVNNIKDPRYTYVLLNILAITIFWFGCNNAAKEIVKEQAVYARERAVNLGILPYLGSKFLVLAVMSAVQTFILVGIVYGVLMFMHSHYGHDYPPPEYILPFAKQYAVLVLLSLVGVSVGLLLSACVASPDRANALLPYVLIPQIILGGAIIPVKGQPITALASSFSPVYWGFNAIHRGAPLLPTYLPMHKPADTSITWACAALAAQMVVALVATAWFLKRKDSR